MFSLVELIGIAVFIAIFFTIMWLYIRHRIWQKSKILETAPPYRTDANRFAGSQLQYPNAGRVPSFLGRNPAVSDGVSGRQGFARRYQGRPYSSYNQSLRPPPSSVMVFTISIPEEEEEDAPPSYDDVIKQTNPSSTSK